MEGFFFVCLFVCLFKEPAGLERQPSSLVSKESAELEREPSNLEWTRVQISALTKRPSSLCKVMAPALGGGGTEMGSMALAGFQPN